MLCDTLQRNITQPCFEGLGFPYKCVRSQHHIKMKQVCVGPVHLCLNILAVTCISDSFKVESVFVRNKLT